MIPAAPPVPPQPRTPSAELHTPIPLNAPAWVEPGEYWSPPADVTVH